MWFLWLLFKDVYLLNSLLTFCALNIQKDFILISLNCNNSFGVCLSGYIRCKGPSIFNLVLLVFLNWDSLVLDWNSWFFTGWVPRLTITICNKITVNAGERVQCILQILLSGLLIFRAVADPRNSGISAKSREIPKKTRNTAKSARNISDYMSAKHI